VATVAEALRLALAPLRAAGVQDAATDARRLMAHALAIDPGRLTLHLPDPMTLSQAAIFEQALTARVSRQPVAQIIGQRDFFGLCFRVTKDTLDPRPDTETLVSEALREPFAKLLDLGTGTGCVLLACLQNMPIAVGTGTDLSPQAIAVAKGNAVALGLAGRARFQISDWFSEVSGRFDLIVSNPPYITATEMADLDPEVREHEPHLALTPGGDGLDAYRAITLGAPARLMAGGRLIVEIGWQQGLAVSQLFAAAGLVGIGVLPDLSGRDRVVLGRMPGDPDSCGCA
jgi:release factor glutamine methyltransferase